MDKLTLDAICARRKGMTYGQYMAAFGGENRAKEKEKEKSAEKPWRYEKTCVICGKLFKTNMSLKITCGAKCAAERNRQKNLENERKRRKERGTIEGPGKYEKTCVICGKTFKTNLSVQITCGKKCAVERNRQKNLEYRRNGHKERENGKTMGEPIGV